MKNGLGLVPGLLIVALAASALMQAPPPAASLARWVPEGPLLVLETGDFAELLGDWNGSEEKSLWLQSANYQAFSKSRLFLRLKEVHKEFAAAAGFAPDMPLAESIAGEESVLALYDIGRLEFLYITKLSSPRRLENLLWQTRANFEPRNVAGSPYYVRVDASSGRMVVFAATDQYLLLATAEDPLAGSLALMAEQGNGPLTKQSWYRDAVRAAGERGDLRMVLDLSAIVRTPYFRSYWIQRNVSELGQYRAGVSDIHRESGEIRERRVFLRSSDATETDEQDSGQAVAELTGLAGESTGFFQAWASPPNDQVIGLLEHKVLAPRAGPPPSQPAAPTVSLAGERVGTEAALETRIDQPPPAPVTNQFSPRPLQQLLNEVELEGMLLLQSSRQDDIFWNGPATVVLLAESPWSASEAQKAVRESLRGLWTTSSLGAEWVERQEAEQAYAVLNGLTNIAVAVRGRKLFLASGIQPLLEALSRNGAPSRGLGATYAASFRHSQERDNYERLMRQLDSLQIRRFGSSANRPPQLFSENLASLSATLGRVREVSVSVVDQGDSVTQTVMYELAP